MYNRITEEKVVKLIAGNVKMPVTIIPKANRLFLKFPFSRPLLEEVKIMQGARWHGFEDPPLKQWSIDHSQRNLFQLDYLQGNNPYADYDKPLIDWKPKRSLYAHQLDLAKHWATYQYMIWAAEMRTGKTLAAMEVIESINCPVPPWWIAPKSALAGVKLEFRKWNSPIKPVYMTYEGLVKVLKEWKDGDKPPVIVVFDESSRLKTPTSQRAGAAQLLADAVRETWGNQGYVLEMTGSPAPKSPADWWKQCEIARPGYLREGNILKFTERLAITQSNESTAGGKYKRIITWKDSDSKCNVCGQLLNHVDHDVSLMADNPMHHSFVACKNEVEYLYKRMKGLVVVKFKKDCLDLPEKIFKRVVCKPNPQTLNAARMILAGAKSAAVALILSRELSDGFQYQTKLKSIPHTACGGKGCELCNNSGITTEEERVTVEVKCPKDDALIDILDEHEEVGRLVVYGGFTGTIDRIERICKEFQWETIRVDGRGCHCSNPEVNGLEEALYRFQDKKVEDRIVFIGHPGSAGMGIDLAASPTAVYFSNDFNAESRIQSVERIHGPAMDINRGATIIDLIHLPTDIKVLDNLNLKRDLQAMSMGELKDAMDSITLDDEREI